MLRAVCPPAWTLEPRAEQRHRGRVRALGAVLAVCVACFAGVSARAQSFPSRPVKLIVGFGPGSATDSFARAFAERLAQELKVPVFVDNKAGGSQVAAIQALRAAPPDGYTLYIGTGSSMAQGPGLNKDVRHQPLRDFSHVAYLATAPGALIVSGDSPFQTVEEMVAYAKAHPGALSFGSSGVGSAGHLAGELFMARTGIAMQHIPYKADTEAAREVGAGTLQLAFTTLRTASSVVGGGRIRALLTLDSRRSPLLAGVPCAPEAAGSNLSDIAPYTWYALVGPAGLSDGVVASLNEASGRVLTQPDFVSLMGKAGVVAEASSPEGLRTIVKKELAKWQRVGAKVKLDY